MGFLVLLRLAALAATVATGPLGAQSLLGHSPNVRGEWVSDRWNTTFVFSHRFEFIEGGDELINLPTLSLGMGLGWRLAAGVDYTSNSEIVVGKLGANETQPWLALDALRAGPVRLHALLARNTAAQSTDASLTARARLGAVSLLGEGRFHSDVFGTGESGSAATGGLVLHLTRYLELSGDVGRMLSQDTVGSVWSAGAAIAIPGSPHTFSLHATNGGAVTLQGVSRPRVLGRQPTRYGFTFSVPLGSRAQWVRIFSRGDAFADEAASDDDAAVTVEMRMIAYTPRELRVRVGDTVEWVNRDPVEHTVTADDGSWTSVLLRENQRYRRTFDSPGRYTYHCTPHPQMTGVVIVEPRGS